MSESNGHDEIDVTASLLAKYIQLRLGPLREPQQLFRSLLAYHNFHRPTDSTEQGEKHD